MSLYDSSLNNINNFNTSLIRSNTINNNNLNNMSNNNRTQTIDFYRSDYIPMRKSYISYMEYDPKNMLGQKMDREEFITKTNLKRNVPAAINDKRYHKTLLQTSLEKIRNEIRQKRLENSQRMYELNEKADSLNDYFRSKNNKGKFTGIFNNYENSLILNEKNSINNSLLEEKNENNISQSKGKGFNKELICFDIHESFSINPNKRKKIDENIFIIQRQSEFAYKNLYKENKNSSLNTNNNKTIISFGAPKEEIKTQPLSNNFSFGVKSQENKNINENKSKVLFGAPKEEIKIISLSE